MGENRGKQNLEPFMI